MHRLTASFSGLKLFAAQEAVIRHFCLKTARANRINRILNIKPRFVYSSE